MLPLRHPLLASQNASNFQIQQCDLVINFQHTCQIMQQQRRIYAGDGRNSGIVAEASNEAPSDDINVVNFLLRVLPKQRPLMASLRDNSENVEVDVDLMEWIDEDYESEHHSAAVICNEIIFNFPHFYKNLSLACDFLRSSISTDQSTRAIQSSQLRCNIKLPCADMLFGSNSKDVGQKTIRSLKGRIASVQTEKQIVKSRSFSCSNDNCRLFMMPVTQNFWFFDDLEGAASSECSSCKIRCLVEDVSACQVAEHQIWMVAFDKECSGRFKLCPVSVYEKIIETPQLHLGCEVEMVIVPLLHCSRRISNAFVQIVFPKRSHQLMAPHHCISWRFLKPAHLISKRPTRADSGVSKPIDAKSFSKSAQHSFDNIMLLHKLILPRWLNIGEVIRVALTAAVASCSDRFRTSSSDPTDGAPLKIVFRTDDQEPVMVIVQTILLLLCKIFEVSFGVVYPNSICTSRESRIKNEDSGFATTLHLLRSGVVLLPQVQELFSDSKTNSAKIDILETIACGKSAVPGTCIIGICCEQEPESTKTKTSNQVRIDRMWDLHFCCKESAKTESLLGLLDSAALNTQDHLDAVFSDFLSEAHTMFASKNDELSIQQPHQDNAIFTAYAQSVAMLTSAAVPSGFSIVKRECNVKHLSRIWRAIQCANFKIMDDGDCVLACVPLFLY
jgi:hypothetical protein